jgi:GTP-binding protein
MVALMGRPNVGKSTLFNRLLHRRRAITDPAPGVTRDPVESRAFLGGKPLRLVDTGGLRLEGGTETARSGNERSAGGRSGRKQAGGDGPDLDSLVRERTLEIAEEADVIVLLLEAGELTAEDEECIALLRPRWSRVIAAVNKTEGGRREGEAWNILSCGFEELILISAEHGDHIAELEAAIVSRLDFSRVEADPEGEDRPVTLALLGKPNTGKSTLSNRLTASAASMVSALPGTTRDVVEGEFRWKNLTFRVLDTAGIRRRSKVTEHIEYYSVNRAVKTLEDADIVFLLIDVREGLSEQDKKITALASQRGRGIILALNKWDTVAAGSGGPGQNAGTAVKDRIRYFFGQMEYAPIVTLSAKDGTGVEELLETSLCMHRQLYRRTDTAVLNQALARWLKECPPPSGPRTRFSVKYAVQVSANPVQFVFFVSRPAAVTEAYKAYLRNRIRRDLGYSMIPVELEIRPSAKPGDRAKPPRRTPSGPGRRSRGT